MSSIECGILINDRPSSTNILSLESIKIAILRIKQHGSAACMCAGAEKGGLSIRPTPPEPGLIIQIASFQDPEQRASKTDTGVQTSLTYLWRFALLTYSFCSTILLLFLLPIRVFVSFLHLSTDFFMITAWIEGTTLVFNFSHVAFDLLVHQSTWRIIM